MAQIDPNVVLTNTSVYIPTENILTNEEMIALINQVIMRVGNDDTNLPQVQCEFLRDLATVNMSRAQVDAVSTTSERVGDHARSRDPAYVQRAWSTFRDSLRDICPLFGYRLPARRRIFINPGEENNPRRDCPERTNLSF